MFMGIKAINKSLCLRLPSFRSFRLVFTFISFLFLFFFGCLLSLCIGYYGNVGRAIVTNDHWRRSCRHRHRWWMVMLLLPCSHQPFHSSFVRWIDASIVRWIPFFFVSCSMLYRIVLVDWKRFSSICIIVCTLNTGNLIVWWNIPLSRVTHECLVHYLRFAASSSWMRLPYVLIVDVINDVSRSNANTCNKPSIQFSARAEQRGPEYVLERSYRPLEPIENIIGSTQAKLALWLPGASRTHTHTHTHQLCPSDNSMSNRILHKIQYGSFNENQKRFHSKQLNSKIVSMRFH